MDSSPNPEAWILASFMPHGTSWVPLKDLLHRADFLMRLVLSHQEIQDGVSGLVARGLLETQGLTLRLTPDAKRLTRSLKAASLQFESYERLAAHFQAHPAPTRGRSAWSLSEQDYELAVSDYRREFAQMANLSLTQILFQALTSPFRRLVKKLLG